MPHTGLSTGLRILLPVLAGLSTGACLVTGASAQALDSFAILGGMTITNTGTTLIDGNVGLSPGSSVTGFAGNVVQTNGAVHVNDSVAQTAKSDLTTAFNIMMGYGATADLTGQVIGSGSNTSLGGGVYSFSSGAELGGTLTLHGDAHSIFVFKIGSTLTVDSNAQVIMADGALASNVFFVVGSSATLGTDSTIQGQILALESITLNHNAAIDCGAAWASGGSVTLDSNTINVCTFQVEPGTFGDTLAGTATDNEREVTDAINAFIAGGGTLPLAFEVLSLLSPDQLAAALAELSGEVATGAAPAGNQAMDSFLDTVLGQPGSERTIIASEDTPPADNTVSVMGYTNGPEAPHTAALASVDAATNAPMPNIAAWTVWGAGYGSISTVGAEAAVGAHALTAQDYGYAVGFERHVSADTLFGFAISSGGTNFDLDDSLGSGHSAMLQAALYSKTVLDNAYVSGLVAYGLHDVNTDRTLDIGGTAQYHAEFLGQDAAAAVEVGYDAGWFTPYVGARVQGYLTPGYSEDTVSGSSMFALDHSGSFALTAQTQVGVKLSATNDFDGGQFTVQGGIAWAHTFWGTNSSEASFQALPGSSFTVTGATPAADMLVLSAGLGAQFDGGVSLGGSIGANIAANARTYKASARLGYNF